MIFILIIYSNFDIIAQIKPYQYIDSDDGLIHGYNDHILKRSNGTIWISSDNGIYEYDGFDLKLYNEMSDTTFHGEIVYSDFFELANDDILFSTDKGILKYDQNGNRFLTIIDNTPDANNEYYLISIESDTAAWARIGDSISYIDIRTGEYISLIPTQSVRFNHRYHKGQVLIAGCPWIQKGGIEFITLNDDNFISSDYLEPTITEAGRSIIPEFSDVFIMNDTLFYAASEYGLFKINPNNVQTTERFKTPDSEASGFLFITMESDSTLVLTTRDNGVWSFNMNSEKFDQILSHHYGLHSNDTREIYLDNSGYYWVSSLNNSQVSYGLLKDSDFSSIATSSIGGNKKPLNFIYEQDHQIRAFNSAGVYDISLDGAYTFSSYFSSDDQQATLSKPYHISQSYNNDHFWVTNENSIFKLSQTNQLLEQYDLDRGRVMSFHQYDSDHALLFTSEDLGILNLINGNWAPIDLMGLSNGPLEITRILSSHERYFLVYNDRTIYEILLDERKVNIDQAISCQSSIFDIDIVRHEDLLISTSNGIEKHTLTDINYTYELLRPKYLSPGTFYNLFDTGNSYLITTSKGLFAADTLFLNWRLFNESSGMHSDEFNYNSGVVTSSGNYLFPAQNNIVIVESDLFQKNFVKPLLHLSQFTVNDRLYKSIINAYDSIFNLNYKQNSISIKPRCISYLNQKNNQLFYRLDKNDTWKKISNSDNLYLRLGSGTYQLQFLGIDTHGVQSSIQSLQLNIAYPFWRTIQFFLAAITSAAFLIFLMSRNYYRNRIKREEEKFQQEKLLARQLEQERNRIAAEMHDELGGGLTSIRLLSQKMSRSSDVTRMKGSINKVEKYSADLIESMRSIVWSMDSSNNTLGDTLSYIRYYVDDALENGDIKVTFNIALDDPHIEMRTTVRHNLYLIIKEIITNVLKHAQASEVSFYCIQRDNLRIRISDNGIGIPLHQESFNGNGVKNIQKRISDIDGDLHITSQEGTTYHITLNINHETKSTH